MSNENNELPLAERIALHSRMAESYGNAYLNQDVQEGGQYDAWTFADGATYASPYFVDRLISLEDFAQSGGKSAVMEAKAYSLTFEDWKPVKFSYWPADNGFVMKTRWEGHTKEGVTMGFFSYSFVETNGKGEVTHWETHVNDEYGPFLDVAIGVRGPFKGDEYMKAVARKLEEHGITETD